MKKLIILIFIFAAQFVYGSEFVYNGANYNLITIADIATQTGRSEDDFHIRRRPHDLEITITFDSATAQEETDLDTHCVTTNGLTKQ